jgi:hypothetical protein
MSISLRTSTMPGDSKVRTIASSTASITLAGSLFEQFPIAISKSRPGCRADDD